MASQACSMLLSALGRVAHTTPTERHQIQLLLRFACPISACKILHLHLHLPKQQASQPEARSTPTCLHRLHCLHGSHDDRCGKRAGAKTSARGIVEVAAATEAMLLHSLQAGYHSHARSLTLRCAAQQTTSCTPRIDLESDVALAPCSHSLTLECSTRPKPYALTLLFFCTRRGPSGSQEPSPKDPATSLETCRHMARGGQNCSLHRLHRLECASSTLLRCCFLYSFSPRPSHPSPHSVTAQRIGN